MHEHQDLYAEVSRLRAENERLAAIEYLDARRRGAVMMALEGNREALAIPRSHELSTSSLEMVVRMTTERDLLRTALAAADKVRALHGIVNVNGIDYASSKCGGTNAVPILLAYDTARAARLACAPEPARDAVGWKPSPTPTAYDGSAMFDAFVDGFDLTAYSDGEWIVNVTGIGSGAGILRGIPIRPHDRRGANLAEAKRFAEDAARELTAKERPCSGSDLPLASSLVLPAPSPPCGGLTGAAAVAFNSRGDTQPTGGGTDGEKSDDA